MMCLQRWCRKLAITKSGYCEKHAPATVSEQEWECPDCKTRYVRDIGKCGDLRGCSRPNVVPVSKPDSDSVGIRSRITVDGHDYMLVSEHYAELNEHQRLINGASLCLEPIDTVKLAVAGFTDGAERISGARVALDKLADWSEANIRALREILNHPFEIPTTLREAIDAAMKSQI